MDGARQDRTERVAVVGVVAVPGFVKLYGPFLLFSFQELVFSASPDATIRIWSVPNASCVQVVRAHESAVTGLSLHATGDYLLSSSDDQVWCQPGHCRGLLVSELKHPGRREHLANTSWFPRTPEEDVPLLGGPTLARVCRTRVPAFLKGTHFLTGSIVSVFSVLGFL